MARIFWIRLARKSIPFNSWQECILYAELLEAAGWRFFAGSNGPANIRLEPTVAIKPADLDALGENFERAERGFVDFLLLDARGFPLIVLEAKAEDKNPLAGKEQARKYARSQNCRFVILSNGNLHYFWGLERGNPNVVTSFPTPESVTGYKSAKPVPTERRSVTSTGVSPGTAPDSTPSVARAPSPPLCRRIFT